MENGFANGLHLNCEVEFFVLINGNHHHCSLIKINTVCSLRNQGLSIKLDWHMPSLDLISDFSAIRFVVRLPGDQVESSYRKASETFRITKKLFCLVEKFPQ